MINADHRIRDAEVATFEMDEGMATYRISGEKSTFGFTPHGSSSPGAMELWFALTDEEGRNGDAFVDVEQEEIDVFLHQLADELGYELVEVDDD